MAEHLYGESFVPSVGKFGHTQALTPSRRPLKTRDGFLSVNPANQAQSAKFLELGGIADAYNSERFLSRADSAGRVEEYNLMVEEAAASRTTAEWMDICEANSIPVMRANRPSEIFEDPQLKQTLFEERHLDSEGTYRAMKPGLRFSKTPMSINRDAPTIGEHTEEVLGAIKT
jgi:crotonobetainyl-CoA:carnitine CoA-transferase CaiB-like acyl-CoA transferase